jgi:hypothetical protein
LFKTPGTEHCYFFSFFSKLEALDSLPLGLGKVFAVHYDFLLFKYTTNFRQEKTLTSSTFVL